MAGDLSAITRPRSLLLGEPPGHGSVGVGKSAVGHRRAIAEPAVGFVEGAVVDDARVSDPYPAITSRTVRTSHATARAAEPSPRGGCSAADAAR